jgi:hypothetical protein
MRSNGGPLGQRCLDDRSHGDRLFEAAFLRFGILPWREQGNSKSMRAADLAFPQRALPGSVAGPRLSQFGSQFGLE